MYTEIKEFDQYGDVYFPKFELKKKEFVRRQDLVSSL